VGWNPDEVDFFNLPNPSSHIMALGLTQPVAEMSTRNIPGDKGWLARRAVTGIPLLYLLLLVSPAISYSTNSCIFIIHPIIDIT
jgi:hypothetical protein